MTHVFNYDMPKDIDSYVHRIGRTGRVGNTGLAISFMNDGDRGVARSLAELLTENDQECPSWLLTMSGYGGGYGRSGHRGGRRGGGRGGASFGARDFRRDGGAGGGGSAAAGGYGGSAGGGYGGSTGGGYGGGGGGGIYGPRTYGPSGHGDY